MATTPQQQTQTNERVLTIPLRPIFQRAPIYKRSARAIHAVKELLVRHLKVSQDAIKLGSSVNEVVFAAGRKHPPAQVKVRTWEEDGKTRVELASFERQTPAAAPAQSTEKNDRQQSKEIKEATHKETATEKIEEEKKEVLQHPPTEKQREKLPLKQSPPQEAKLDRQEDIFPKSQKPAHEKKKVGR